MKTPVSPACRLLGLLTMLLAAQPLCAGGLRLAYEKNGAIWLADGALDAPRKLTSGQRPALRPDGRVLAFVRQKASADTGADPVAVWLRDLDSGAERAIFSDTVVDGPVWSPDGRSLAYAPYVEPGTPARLLIAGAASGERRSVPLPRDPAPDSLWSLEWLPDGSGLGFHDMHHYWQLSPAGQVLLRLAVPGFAGERNPDGRQRGALSSADTVAVCPANSMELAYTEDARGSPAFERALYGEPISALLLSATEGAPAPRRLTDASLTVCDAVWAPGGQSLFICGYRDVHAGEEQPFRIFRVERESARITEIDRGQNPSVAAPHSGPAPGMEESEGPAGPPAADRPPAVPAWRDLSQRRLGPADLAGLDAATLRLLRNEIYARHGRRFKSEDLRRHFAAQPWYQPRRDEVSEDELSTVERANLRAIQTAEKHPAMRNR